MTPFRIALINMPFADITQPSLPLTQLKAVLDRDQPGALDVQILYLNHDFATYFGVDVYRSVARDGRHHTSGFGEWLFRQVAFPSLPDNRDKYLTRYYPAGDVAARTIADRAMAKRSALSEFMVTLVERYALHEADLVGFTSMFSQTAACIAMARCIRTVANRPPLVVIGGANCEYPMGQVIAENVDVIDYVFSGPSLVGFPQFVRCVRDGKRDQCRTIKGVLSKSRASVAAVSLSAGVRLNAGGTDCHATLGEELDINTPIPLDYRTFLESYAHTFGEGEGQPSLTFETSRGCWWGEKAHCTFCGLNGSTMHYRAMRPDVALAQFQSLFDYVGKCQQLQCVDNILPKEYLQDVLPGLNTPESISIFYETKADLGEEDLRVLAKARVKSIQPGIEALATNTLRLMKKGTTAFQNIALLKRCVTYEVEPAWNLLVGFPGEPASTYEKYVNDLPLLTHLPAPVGVFPVRFDRYSPYFSDAKSFELDLQPYEYYRLTYPFDDDALRRLAYYFTDHNYQAQYFIDMLTWLDRLRHATARWRRHWAGAVRPVLEMTTDDNGGTILDTRSGVKEEYRVSAEEMALLKRLDRPTSLAAIAEESSKSGDTQVEARLATLRRRHLLFEESGKAMNLLVPRVVGD